MIHGARYNKPHLAVLAKFIEEDLHSLDMRECLEFYHRFTLRTKDPDAWALLACNDRFFLGVVILGRKDLIHNWLFGRCREVEAEPDGFIDLWSRAHYKSTIITMLGVMQEVCRNPEITIGIFSFNKQVASKFLEQIKREFEANDMFRWTFADICWIKPKDAPVWSVDKGIIVRRQSNPKEATVEAHGLVEGQPTSRHFALMVYDDVVTRESVTTPEMIKKTTEAFELSDNLGTTEGARKWIVGTRYHFGDTYGVKIEEGAYKVRLYPATHDGSLTGRPVLLTPETWEKKKREQRSTVSAQMLQNPIAGNENSFKPDWFRPYEVRPAVMNVYILVDPSKGRTKKSDRTAIAVIGLDPQGNKFLLDGYRHRMSLSERWNALKELYRKWTRAPGVQMVRVGYEAFGQQTDEEHFKLEMERSPQDSFPIVELSWPREGGNSKKDRVERLEPDFRLGRFFLPAAVWHGGVDSEFSHWKFEDGKMVYTKANITKSQRLVIERDQKWRVVLPIKRFDEDKKVYDVTRSLMEEMMFFPFSTHDDLVDATSRIYDIGAIPPLAAENDVPLPEWEDA